MPAAIDQLAYATQATAHRQAPVGMVEVFLDLFDGHGIPATHYTAGFKPGFYKSPRITKQLAFESHALGVLMAGAYPFRGVTPWCACEEGKHVCDGYGCRYFLLDIDAHRGESDTFERVAAVLGVSWRLGLTPVVFSSRGGAGAHVFFFLDASVSTRVANAAGRNLAKLAGINSRCDIIPSAAHHAGFGTLHALPLSPMTAAVGGGVMFDSNLKPVPADSVIAHMQWAHHHRSSSGIAFNLANADVAAVTVDGEEPIQLRALGTSKPVTLPRERAMMTDADKTLLADMRARHPQFKRVLESSPESWQGGRSSRDAYLVGCMRRQGMPARAIVAALRTLPGTKAEKRSEEYVWRLLDAQSSKLTFDVKLAGQKLRRNEGRRQRARCEWAPWDVRVAPPQTYGGAPSTWWSEPVQHTLKKSRSNVDGIVLGYIVDRYHRGPKQRQLFYASNRGIGRALGLSPTTVGASVNRLQTRLSDVLQVIPGVSHRSLRIANGFYLREDARACSENWHIVAGRDG